MNRSMLIAFLAATLAWSLASAAGAAEHTVVLTTSLTFEPAELTIQVGDTVTWTNNGGSHNVRADDGSFRCSSGCDGEGGDGSPSGANWSFSRTFDDPAVIPYFCEVHGAAGGAGMSGRLTVADGGAPPADSDAIFADGFESGDTCRWSGRENLPACGRTDVEPDGNFLRVSEAASRAKSSGSFGLESIYSPRSDAVYLVDDSPAGVRRYLLTFWLQPTREFSMERGTSHVLIEALQRANPQRVFTVSIEGQKKSKIFRVRVGAQTEAGFEDLSSLKVKRGKWRRVTLDWVAPREAGGAGGFVCLSKKAECPRGKRKSIENPTLVVDSVRFGQVERPDFVTSGTIYLDDFNSRTTSAGGGQDQGEDGGGSGCDGADCY